MTIVRSCFFHLRHLKSVRRILGRKVTLGLVSAFVTTRLDYCNSVLTGLPQVTIDPLQRVQYAAARLVAGIETQDHITPVLRSLHWLPIRLRIQYKLCVLMHLVRSGRSPAYLADMMTATADLPGRERLWMWGCTRLGIKWIECLVEVVVVFLFSKCKQAPGRLPEKPIGHQADHLLQSNRLTWHCYTI